MLLIFYQFIGNLFICYLPLPSFGSRTQLEFACPSLSFFLFRGLYSIHTYTHRHTITISCARLPAFACQDSMPHRSDLGLCHFFNPSFFSWVSLSLIRCKSTRNDEALLSSTPMRVQLSTTPEWRRIGFISFRLPVGSVID